MRIPFTKLTLTKESCIICGQRNFHGQSNITYLQRRNNEPWRRKDWKLSGAGNERDNIAVDNALHYI